MRLSMHHEATIEQLVAAFRANDSETVRAIVGDTMTPFHEMLFIVAGTCDDATVDRFHLARMISDVAYGLVADSERLAKLVINGDLATVIRELGARDRTASCCLVAMISDIARAAPAAFMAQMQFLSDNPECLGADV